MKLSCDVFCRVVDNFGDVGVCWRLARQLSDEYGVKVRFWLDDVPSLSSIWNGVNADLASQVFEGIEVCRWDAGVDWACVVPSDWVIEGFACQLPDGFVAQMVMLKNRSGVLPKWVNLEYLSAEAWVDGCHRLNSPQRNGLSKTFFFPGFTAKTGGLLREKNLLADREDMLRTRPRLWTDLTGFESCVDALKMVLFGYETMRLHEWLPLLIESKQPFQLAVTCGKAALALREAWRYLGLGDDVLTQGALSIRYLPMLRQDAFDALLWSADFNFVRGEDSLVRALWAGKPFTWQIYPQEDGVHFEKLTAFNQNYTSDGKMAALAAWSNWQHAWNAQPAFDIKASWKNLIPYMSELTQHAHQHAEKLAQTDDLAQQLMQHFLNE